MRSAIQVLKYIRKLQRDDERETSQGSLLKTGPRTDRCGHEKTSLDRLHCRTQKTAY